MVDPGPWMGGELPGRVAPTFSKKEKRQTGWFFRISGKMAPLDVPCSKTFLFLTYGDGAKAAAEDHQRKIIEDHGIFIRNQYRYCEDPEDGVPYIELHIRDTAGKDYYSLCDVGDLPLIEDHVWCTHVEKGKNVYLVTSGRIDGKRVQRSFHRSKRPDLPKVDHINRNGLDNRSKNLRDGSEGINENNCGLGRNNTSGANGVSYDKKNRLWRAGITHDGIRLPRRSFPGPHDFTHPSYHAACAYALELMTQVGSTNGQ